jgi:hypothetical protein
VIENLRSSTKHYPIKFIEFFILAIENKFLAQFKNLIREDHPRRYAGIPIKKNFNHFVDGDYMNFVDTYVNFIDELKNRAEQMAPKAILTDRFLKRSNFAEQMTIGVHTYIMKQLYRNIF